MKTISEKLTSDIWFALFLSVLCFVAGIYFGFVGNQEILAVYCLLVAIIFWREAYVFRRMFELSKDNDKD